MRTLYWVWRRELQVTLRAPIVYVVGGLFLAVQGIAFAGLVGALSDPRKPAPLGALLEGQLSGTLLTWVLQLVVLTLLGMRTIADDKRGGGWELLLTARVSEAAAVTGKWLAATTVYALLWIPTLAYLVVVAMFRADAGGWDVPTIVCGYAGAIALGAALLAWAVAASAATTTSLAAGALGFAALIAIFLAGELPAVWPGLDVPEAIRVRGQLTTFARGELSLPAIVLIAGLAVTGLSLAITLACAGRRRDTRRRALATGLVAVISALALVLAARHPASWDVSAARRNSLDPETRALLAGLPAPATLTIVEPTLGALEPIYDEVARVAERMANAGPVTVRRVDPASLPGGLPAAARLAGIPARDLASNGGVVVEVGGKRRVVDRLQLADVEVTAGSAEIAQVAIERAITGALAELTEPTPITACFTTAHGELPVDHAPKDADWSAVADRLRAAGVTIEVLEGRPSARCDVVVVAGPATPLSADEALALQAHVAAGRGLLVAAASRPINGTLAPTGLEGLLGNEGLLVTSAIAVDPTLAVRELPGALLVVSGYAKHPVNEGFEQARATLWYEPRVLRLQKGGAPLISASKASWGETRLDAAPARDEGDLPGPVVLAGAGAHRVIAVGSAESFATSFLEGGASAGDLWLAHAVRWLAGKPPPAVAVAARAPDQVRLVMTNGQRRAVVALCTAGIPLAWILLGGGLLLLRRRRA
jgi:ABC-2 type transport system permease protein